MTVLVWTWRYGSPEVWETHDDRWVASVKGYEDIGECWVEGAEVNGRFYSVEDIWAMPEYKALGVAEKERWERQRAERSKKVKIEVKHPQEDRWAYVDDVLAEKADTEIARWARLVGGDRVRVGKR